MNKGKLSVLCGVIVSANHIVHEPSAGGRC